MLCVAWLMNCLTRDYRNVTKSTTKIKKAKQQLKTEKKIAYKAIKLFSKVEAMLEDAKSEFQEGEGWIERNHYKDTRIWHRFRSQVKRSNNCKNFIYLLVKNLLKLKYLCNFFLFSGNLCSMSSFVNREARVCSWRVILEIRMAKDYVVIVVYFYFKDIIFCHSYFWDYMPRTNPSFPINRRRHWTQIAWKEEKIT